MSTFAVTSLHGTVADLDPMRQIAIGYLARCKTDATRRAYTEDLKHFLAWCERERVEPLLARRVHLDLYVRWMQSQSRWAEQTIARRIGTVCGMYEYAAAEDHLPKNPGMGVERPTVDRDKQHRTWLNPADFGTLLKTAAAAGPREHGLVALLGMMGLRVGEACSLNVEHVSRAAGYTVLHFIGKGNKAAAVPVPVPAMRALDELIGARDCGPLLLNAEGARMDRAAAARMLHRLCKAAGLAQDITPHSLRRTFATSGLLSKVPLYEVQVAMRHRSPSTTVLYDMARLNPDRNATHAIAGFMASMAG